MAMQVGDQFAVAAEVDERLPKAVRVMPRRIISRAAFRPGSRACSDGCGRDRRICAISKTRGAEKRFAFTRVLEPDFAVTVGLSYLPNGEHALDRDPWVSMGTSTMAWR